MKKFLMCIAFIAAISSTSCKKDGTCWECVDQNGTDFSTICDGSEVQQLKDQGYTCNQK